MSFQSYGIRTAALLLASALGVAAQSTPPSAAAGPSKVAYVDIRTALENTAEGRQKLAELQSQFSPKQAELENMQKGLEDLQARLNAGLRTLSDDERARMQREGELRTHQLQRKQQDFEEEATAAKQGMFEGLSRKMAEVVTRYARENGYSLILDSQVACGVYCLPQLDVTQEIIHLYDQANPVKAGSTTPSATPRPAAGRPAAQPATPAPTKKPPR